MPRRVLLPIGDWLSKSRAPIAIQARQEALACAQTEAGVEEWLEVLGGAEDLEELVLDLVTSQQVARLARESRPWRTLRNRMGSYRSATATLFGAATPVGMLASRCFKAWATQEL